MEFYCGRKSCFRFAEIVSIPNGMEFYIPHRLERYERRKTVSIPNGMEFYANGEINGFQTSLFQFPTGYNSTNLQRCILCSAKPFQFPTGWNSTVFKASDDEYSDSFNSQRDGILRKAISFLIGQVRCFNSQRDGILPVCRARAV